MPRTRLQSPDGAVLSVGTRSCDDQIHQAVYLAYSLAGSSTPTMKLEPPPKSVEVIIRELQEHANQARFINGEPMLEYLPPSAGAARRTRIRRRKKKTGQSAPPKSGPAAPVAESGASAGPASAS